MTDTEGRPIASTDEDIAAFLAAAGIAPDVTGNALAIDGILQRWRRRVNKRELGHMAVQELGLDIDLPKLDVLMATSAPSNEFGAEEDETMVSTIACRLGIDPSRASRLVSDLITHGLLVRGVSQKDARRTIVELTPRGRAIVDAVRRFKFLLLGNFLKGWRQEEIDTFLPLLERFSTWSEDSLGDSRGDLAPQLAELRQNLARDTD